MKLSATLTLSTIITLASASTIRLYTTLNGNTNAWYYLCGSTETGLTECATQLAPNITTYDLDQSIGSISLIEDTSSGPVKHPLGLVQDTSSFPLASALELVFFWSDANYKLNAVLENQPISFYAAQNINDGDLYTIGGVVGDINRFNIADAENLQPVTIGVEIIS